MDVMSFGLGVLAAITSTIILYIVRHFLGKVLIPLSLIFLSRETNISGVWETEFWKDDNSYKETARVSQLFDKVWGTIEFRKAGQLRKYKMRGTVKERILSATYETVSPKAVLDRGSFTLALERDGRTLVGWYSWTDDESPTPKGNKYVWTKLQHNG